MKRQGLIGGALCGWILITWLGLSSAQIQAPLSLAEAQILALKENPGLKAAGLSLATAEAEVAKARARFLPQVSFSEAYNFSDNPTQVFMHKLNQRRFTEQDFQIDNLNNPQASGNWRTGVALSQPLFQAGEAYLGYQQSRLKHRQAESFVLSRRQQVLHHVTQAYFGLQLARERLKVMQQAKAIAQDHLKLAKDRFAAGAVIQADVLSAEVNLAKITQEELTAESQVAVAASALDTAVGQTGLGLRPLSPAPREPAPLPENLETLQQIAQDRRPDLKGLELEAQAAQKEYAKARLNPLPRLRLLAEYDVNQRRLFSGHIDSYTIMAVMQVNLFNGLADLARQRETKAQEAQAWELRKELADRIRHQVTEAALTLKTAHERLKVAKAAATQAAESLRLIRLRYAEGLTLLVDLLTAENAKKEADLNQLAALFDTHIAQAGLELALGRLTGPVMNSGR
ncbi:MAG: TolC family protein [Desulfobaccales bacterium]